MSNKFRILKIEDITDEFEEEHDVDIDSDDDFYDQFDEEDFEDSDSLDPDLGDDFYDQFDEDDFEDSYDDEQSDQFADIEPEKDLNFSDEDELDTDGNSEYTNGEFDLDDDPDNFEEDEDPNFQGVIRSVKGAAMVYKREQGDSTYEELWIFSSGENMKEDTKLKRAILSGTDIIPEKGRSEDGEQKADLWTVGNVTFVEITGLPQ